MGVLPSYLAEYVDISAVKDARGDNIDVSEPCWGTLDAALSGSRVIKGRTVLLDWSGDPEESTRWRVVTRRSSCDARGDVGANDASCGRDDVPSVAEGMDVSS